MGRARRAILLTGEYCSMAGRRVASAANLVARENRSRKSSSPSGAEESAIAERREGAPLNFPRAFRSFPFSSRRLIIAAHRVPRRVGGATRRGARRTGAREGGERSREILAVAEPNPATFGAKTHRAAVGRRAPEGAATRGAEGEEGARDQLRCGRAHSSEGQRSAPMAA